MSLADVMILGGCAAIEQAAKERRPRRRGALRTGAHRRGAGADKRRVVRRLLRRRRLLPEHPRAHRAAAGSRAVSAAHRAVVVHAARADPDGDPGRPRLGRQEPSTPVTCSRRTPRPVTVTTTPGNELPFASTTAPSMAPVRWAIAAAAAHDDNNAAAMPSRTARRSVPRAADVLPESAAAAVAEPYAVVPTAVAPWGNEGLACLR